MVSAREFIDACHGCQEGFNSPVHPANLGRTHINTASKSARRGHCGSTSSSLHALISSRAQPCFGKVVRGTREYGEPKVGRRFFPMDTGGTFVFRSFRLIYVYAINTVVSVTDNTCKSMLQIRTRKALVKPLNLPQACSSNLKLLHGSLLQDSPLAGSQRDLKWKCLTTSVDCT